MVWTVYYPRFEHGSLRWHIFINSKVRSTHKQGQRAAGIKGIGKDARTNKILSTIGEIYLYTAAYLSEHFYSTKCNNYVDVNIFFYSEMFKFLV